MKMLIAIVFVLGTLFVYIDKTDGACCYTKMGNHCADCQNGTPYCGYGRCNIFGCACKGGCRKARSGLRCALESDGWCRCRLTRSLSQLLDPQPQVNTSVDVKDAFNEIDTNKNNEIDLEEFTKALKERGITNEEEISKHWKKMDQNKDGVITMDELDK